MTNLDYLIKEAVKCRAVQKAKKAKKAKESNTSILFTTVLQGKRKSVLLQRKHRSSSGKSTN